MSLFGKMTPIAEELRLASEVRALLDETARVAYRSSANEVDEETLRFLYVHLEVLMFFEILSHLPGEHLDAFVQMNDGKRSRAAIDAFLEENMPHAEAVFASAVAKFREHYARIGGWKRV